MVRQELSLEGKLRLQVAWQDAEGIDEILTRALPAWDKERPHLVARVLQQCLEAQYSAGVAVALSHGVLLLASVVHHVPTVAPHKQLLIYMRIVLFFYTANSWFEVYGHVWDAPHHDSW